MTEQEIEKFIREINAMPHYEMCRQWRFSKSGQYPWFDTRSPLWPIWQKRYQDFGGMTSEISKSLGWD